MIILILRQLYGRLFIYLIRCLLYTRQNIFNQLFWYNHDSNLEKCLKIKKTTATENCNFLQMLGHIKWLHSRHSVKYFSRILQIHLWGSLHVCTIMKISMRMCTMHDVDRKTFPVLQCTILQSSTSFLQIDMQYFSHSFWGTRQTDLQTNTPTNQPLNLTSQLTGASIERPKIFFSAPKNVCLLRTF